MTCLTDEVRALIGVQGEPVTASSALTADSLRRFVQAVMDSSPLHWDSDAAAAGRYGAVVAPPLWPTHAFVRAPGTPDPLDALTDEPNWDGVGRAGMSGGLPKVDIPQQRLVNGGTEAEFFQLAKVGDIVTARARYADITEREGRSGPMVIVKTETTYTNQCGEVLCVVTKSAIWR